MPRMPTQGPRGLSLLSWRSTYINLFRSTIIRWQTGEGGPHKPKRNPRWRGKPGATNRGKILKAVTKHQRAQREGEGSDLSLLTMAAG
jgi:hypothetical protein